MSNENTALIDKLCRRMAATGDGPVPSAAYEAQYS